MKELVLDISHWDGDIDLQAWKNKHNLWGVIIKAGGNEKSLGRYKDPKFEVNYEKAIKAGLHIGFYYYTTSTDTSSANVDANHMVDIIGNRSYDLPWYMDVEDPAQFNLSVRKLTDVIKSFCNTLLAAKKYAGIYTGGFAWLSGMLVDELRDYANWIAWWKKDWPVEAGDIGMWQQGCIRYSDGNIVFDDVSGYHDCNWCCIDYPARIKNGWTKKENDISEDKKEEDKKEEDKKEEVKNGQASDVIGAAYGELGYYAPDDPERGSKYGRWMAELTGEDWYAGPSVEIWWCCMFVSWCLNKAGVKMDGFPSANTDYALDGGARKYAVDAKSVKYGDIIIFNWDWDNTTDHIGFATGEFDGTGFTTIEGNVGNAVKECYRQLGNVAYVLRPPYDCSGVVEENTPSVRTDPKNNRDGGKLDVDGIGGWNTIIDIQNQLGVEETGWISGQDYLNKEYHKGMCNVTYEEGGSETVKAIQRMVGVEDDGYLGPMTSRGLQQWLIDRGYSCGDCGVDGYFGHDSVYGLQNALNNKELSK